MMVILLTKTWYMLTRLWNNIEMEKLDPISQIEVIEV